MVMYVCADDYGLCEIASERIQKCVDSGMINKVSVFPNFDLRYMSKISAHKRVSVSLHLNLVEGKCTSDAHKIDLLADEDGCFRHTFGGLLIKSILCKRKFESQVYTEIKSQIALWRDNLPEGAELFIDSHQHTHMIPGVFRALIRVIKEEGLSVRYLRIPAEPLSPYIKTPSLYLTYKPLNIVKQWLLKCLWMVNKRYLPDFKIPTAYFFGILFSGKMDYRRVSRVLPHYIELAKKHGKDIEVLFHPGYVLESETAFDSSVSFDKFYLSPDRKTEFDAVMNDGLRIFINQLGKDEELC